MPLRFEAICPFSNCRRRDEISITVTNRLEQKVTVVEKIQCRRCHRFFEIHAPLPDDCKILKGRLLQESIHAISKLGTTSRSPVQITAA